MPDLRYLDCRVDYSIKTFGAVVSLCKDLGIRHPEELSLCKPLLPEHLKRNYADLPKKKIPVEQNGNHQNREYIHPAPDTNTFIPTHGTNFHGSDNSLDGPNGHFCAPVGTLNRPQPHTPAQQSTPISSPTGTLRTHGNGLNYSFNDSSSSLGDCPESLAYSPRAPSPEVRSKLVKPKTLVERARMNVG